MTSTQVVGCQQEGCPIVDEGRCLENFPEGDGCPHILTAEPPADVNQEAERPSSEEDAVEPGQTAPDRGEANRIELGGDGSLSIREADRIAATYGANVVLVAGEFESGKTTLVAEVYGRFLKGPFLGWSFAGAETLYALDRRYHGTRVSSGLDRPDTGRTEEEEMRLLDFRVRKDARMLSLMFTDVRGEFFENVIQGAPVEKEVPLAVRSDQVLLLLDGEKMASALSRGQVVSHARQLIGGLTEAGGLRTNVPLAIVLAKADYVDDDGRRWFSEQGEQLLRFASSRGCKATDVFVAAARPAASPHEPEGLGPIFKWVTTETRRDADVPGVDLTAGRSFWRVTL